MFKDRPVSGFRRILPGLSLALVLSQLVQPAAAESRSATEVFRLTAAQFEEPFLATGATTAAEDAALEKAIELYRGRKVEDDFGSLTGFLADYPQSGWRVAVLTNLGLSYYHDGYFSKAIDALEQAWRIGRAVEEPQAKALVDRAIGELMRMHARLGHADRLAVLFSEVGNRPVSGPATEAVTGAKEGLWEMRNEPGVAYLCGPMALRNLLLAQGAQREKIATVEKYRSGPHGVSLQQVGQLAGEAQLSYQLVFRKNDQPIPVPSIVHWKVSHFAAIVGQRDGRFHVEDPTFGQDLWISRAAIDSEASGYFLVPNTSESAAWRPVGKSEADQVRGMGFTNAQQTGANTPGEVTTCSAPTGNPGSTSSSPNASSPGPTAFSGMCDYSITMLTVGVRLQDTPVGYTPPKGPDMHVMVVYNQREDSQPATFGWFNVSPKWTLNWLSYIQDDPNNPGNNVMRYVAGGGSVAYGSYTWTSGYSAQTGTFAPETRDASVLARTSGTPITYERRLQDGGREVYSESNGAASYPRRIFLTQVVDRFGNVVTLNYDSQLRLTHLTDATGRETTFSYGLAAPNSLLVTKITDPFGRNASLAYDSLGRLTQIIDVLGLKSRFTYDGSGLIDALTTPYGTTSFVYGDNGTTRWVNATDPLGQTERVEFQHAAPGINNDPANTVPEDLQFCDCYLYYRNSFYWDKHAYATAAGDYTKARITHFHHWLFNPSETAHSVHSIKLPLENRVWFSYPGQTSGDIYSGTYDRPTVIARVLDDGTTQATKLTYNVQGNVTDAIDPVGRETQFVYDTNGIDLLQVNQKTSATGFSTLAKFIYNSQHLPLSSTDAAGQQGTSSYNSAGQPTQSIDALGQATAYEYDGFGYLTRIVNANNKTAASFTYTATGDLASRTDSEGYTVNYEYDAMDRITKESYPDGTSREYVYNKLDLASATDRQGRVTQYAYDAVRQLVQINDPLQRKTRFAYYENGVRKSLSDPNGNTTSWDVDLESRVIAKVYADGKGTANTYENTTSRLKTVTDALGQSKEYSYTLDDQLAGISYAHAVNATPSVSFTYDPYFSRLATMTDGSGATQYAYQPAGSLGALRLTLENGPFQNDTIHYQYDALGRLAKRTVDTSTEVFGYDKLSRLTTQANALGTFDLGYLGQTGQLISQQLVGSLVGTSWIYDSNTNDRRLKAITNSGATRSYQFTITPENDITQITETTLRGSAWPAQSWTFGYDQADRLLQGRSSTGAEYHYGYDAANNITSQQGLTGNESFSYSELNQVSSFTYDANGNLLDDATHTYAWDAENRLLSVTSKSQSDRSTMLYYDGLGRRTAIITNGVETRYLWCGEQICQGRAANNAVTRSYFDQGEWIPAGGIQLYYALDQLGSVRDVLTAQNGVRVASYDYNPYGIASQTAGRVGTDFRYADMFYEPNSGLYFTHFRVYDPKTARWLSRDPIYELGGYNIYGYALNNPISQFDAIGLCPSNGLTTCSGVATFTGVGGKQAMGNGALYSDYPKQAGGSIEGGTFGTVAVQKGFLGLTTRQLRMYGTQILITPGNQDLISKYGGPTGPLSVSDYGDENIQQTSGVAFDIYRFPTVAAGNNFGRQSLPVTISFPSSLGIDCPEGFKSVQ